MTWGERLLLSWFVQNAVSYKIPHEKLEALRQVYRPQGVLREVFKHPLLQRTAPTVQDGQVRLVLLQVGALDAAAMGQVVAIRT
jgi:hypothetical protein